jgi:two-component system NarL family response regulator
MGRIRTLLVDDHRLFVETLAVRLLHEPDIEVLPVASDEHEALTLLCSFAPSVAVVDLMLRPAGGLTLVDEISAHHSQCHAVVLTCGSDAGQVVDAVRRGAFGWLSKTADVDHLVRVIRGVARGEAWIPPDLLGHVLRALAAPRSAARPDPLVSLTVRERDVLQCAVDGLSKVETARQLFVSPNTVRTHTQNMLGKLPVRSMIEAVSLARRHGMRPSSA